VLTQTLRQQHHPLRNNPPDFFIPLNTSLVAADLDDRGLAWLDLIEGMQEGGLKRDRTLPDYRVSALRACELQAVSFLPDRTAPEKRQCRQRTCEEA
jgi:hypothetical protein